MNPRLLSQNPTPRPAAVSKRKAPQTQRNHTGSAGWEVVGAIYSAPQALPLRERPCDLPKAVCQVTRNTPEPGVPALAPRLRSVSFSPGLGSAQTRGCPGKTLDLQKLWVTSTAPCVQRSNSKRYRKQRKEGPVPFYPAFTHRASSQG